MESKIINYPHLIIIINLRQIHQEAIRKKGIDRIKEIACRQKVTIYWKIVIITRGSLEHKIKF